MGIYWEFLLFRDPCGVLKKVPIVIRIELREDRLKLIKVIF